MCIFMNIRLIIQQLSYNFMYFSNEATYYFENFILQRDVDYYFIFQFDELLT